MEINRDFFYFGKVSPGKIVGNMKTVDSKTGEDATYLQLIAKRLFYFPFYYAMANDIGGSVKFNFIFYIFYFLFFILFYYIIIFIILFLFFLLLII